MAFVSLSRRAVREEEIEGHLLSPEHRYDSIIGFGLRPVRDVDTIVM